jgi:ABC-2 type transport system ATP-binding protein
MVESQLTHVTSTSANPAADPGSEHGDLALEAYDIRKTWDKRRGPVLDGLDLMVPRGTVTWIAGRNGAGKTTLLRILIGLIASETGQVRVLGMDPWHDRREFQRATAMLSAGNVGLYSRLSVRQQLDHWARIQMVPRRERRTAVDRVLEMFELTEFVDRRSDRLSMGQRQRVRLAVTFVSSPRVVLLDEPLTSLDTEGAAMVNVGIDEVLARDGAVVWVSPTGDDVARDLHQSLLLEGGRLHEHGSA